MAPGRVDWSVCRSIAYGLLYAWPFRKRITLSLYQNSYFIKLNVLFNWHNFSAHSSYFPAMSIQSSSFRNMTLDVLVLQVQGNGTIPILYMKHHDKIEMIKEPGLCQIINSACRYGMSDHLFVEIELWITVTVDLWINCSFLTLSPY